MGSLRRPDPKKTNGKMPTYEVDSGKDKHAKEGQPRKSKLHQTPSCNKGRKFKKLARWAMGGVKEKGAGMGG